MVRSLVPASSKADASPLVLLVPINPLWKVQISLQQKAAILAMFSLTVITMALAIIRAALGLRGFRDDDTWFFICTTIELTTGKPTQALFPCSADVLSISFFSNHGSLSRVLPIPLYQPT